eukprot:CAMPEP_0173427810 /NCGR_PEP_ID=MMETSP1357-20121228/6916_1 /TAXON_ID=77926 /ORGANISM="Hemiselmis rufescens, Strain PCC563" /LENGTH=380 /DNA_ID=CAMNT_0014391721 /DNA_START=31 /DNA_END=1173 /DNA_ORIENTATION=-
MTAIVVIGATGSQGTSVLQHLYAYTQAKKEEGLKLYAMSRDLGGARAMQMANVFPGVQMVAGDMEDKESLKAAFRTAKDDGAKEVRVFAMTTPCLMSGGMVADPVKEAIVGCAMIDAAKEEEVSHLVFSSVANCDKDNSPPCIKSKSPIEDHLKKSGLSYTILRPVTMIEVWDRVYPITSGRVCGMVDGSVKLQWVSTMDIGAVAMLSLVDPKSHKGETIDLCGDVASGNDIAASVTEMRKGQKFTYGIAWITRFVVWCFASLLFDERVRFPLEGGFKADLKPLAKISASYPDCFKRKGPLTYARILLSGGMDTKVLPMSGGVGKVLMQLVLGLLVVIALCYTVLPTSVVEDLKRRWAFYGLCLLGGTGVLLQTMSRSRA